MHSSAKVSKSALAATAVALLAATGSYAMGNQFTELDRIIQSDIAGLGIPAPDYSKLSYAQLAEISGILSQGDKHPEQQKAEIEKVLNGPDAGQLRSVAEVPGGTELERLVVGDLKGYDITVAHPETLTIGQLERLSDLMNGMESSGHRDKAALEAVLNM